MLYTVEQLAEHLDICPSTVNRLRKEKGLPFCHQNRRTGRRGGGWLYMYDLDKVKEWLADPETNVGQKLLYRFSDLVPKISVKRHTKNHEGEWFSQKQIAQMLNFTMAGVKEWAELKTAPPMLVVGDEVFYKVVVTLSWMVANENEVGFLRQPNSALRAGL
jgi:hypothetical protein